MKKTLLSIILLTSGTAMANTAMVYTNDDESGIVIGGEAAKTIYDKMAVAEVTNAQNNLSQKFGKNISCTKITLQSKAISYTCHMGLVEVEGSGGLEFTGEVTEN